jgi:hypothetical protein
MKNWYNTQKDIYTVAIEVEGTAWTYFRWNLNYQGKRHTINMLP